MTLLAVEGLVARHGLLPAVREVSLSIAEGEVLALVGANGAGKSTLLRTVAGAHPAAAGRVVLDGEDVTGLPAHQRVARGLALVPEGRRLFPDLTVEENLLVAGGRARPGRWQLSTVLEAFPMLGPLRHRRASTLSGGEQQATAIGRALMTNPRLLILDEATEGLAPLIRQEIWERLATLKREGLAILIIDKNVEALLRLSDRHLILEKGRIVWSGTSRALAADPLTRDRYLSV